MRANASPPASANPSPADVESDDASDDSDLVRAEEFARLDGVAYCDHAGAPPYSESLVRECMTELTSKLLGNPHSSHGAASTTAAAVAAARDATLQHLNAPVGAYVVVFTSGATAALRLIAESFPWSPSSEFRYTASNHTSVVGIRAAAMHAGARVAVVDVRAAEEASEAAEAPESAEAADRDDDDDKGRRRWRIVERAEILPERTPPRHHFAPSRESENEDEDEDEDEDVAECLFAYPAECNLSGERFHPSVAAAARAADEGTRPPSSVGTPYPPRPRRRRRRWRVLCDAAKCAGTRPPDLSRDDAPDFAVVSYYKMFGYPTGLGALVARRDALASLRPRYFGGGVAAGVDADEDFFRRRSGAEGLEDGTLDFAALTAVPVGFRWLANLARAGDGDAIRSTSREGAAAVDARARSIARRLARRLAALRHPDGARVVRLHGAAWVERHGEETARAASPGGVEKKSHGGTVAFSVLRPDGSPVGCVRVERAAAAEGVHVRAGCCCNPGACELAVGAPPGRPRRAHAAGKVCGDDVDVDDEGVAMGVVRASFGASSAPEDADRLADVVARHFARDLDVGCETARGDETAREGTARVRVTRVATFPIKGAAAFEPPGGAWPVGPNGLLYDREWALASPSGEILCPRRVPAIARLRPEIDLVRETLRVRVERAPKTGTGSGLDEDEPPAPLVASLRELDAGDETATVRLRGTETTVRLAGGARAKVDAWFTAAIGAPCALVRSKPGERRSRARRSGPGAGTDTGTDTGAAIGLANSAQILLVSDASVSHLAGLVRERAARGEDRPRHDANPSPSPSPSRGLDAGRFRANVVVGGVGLEPYAEETAAWTAIRVGGARLAAVRPCVRCDAISAPGADDDAPPGEPAASLAAFRAERRRRTGTGTGTGARVGGGGGGFTFGVLFDVVPKTHAGDATDAGMGSDVPGDVPGDGSGDGSGDAGTRGRGATRPAPGSREWMSRRWGAGGVLAVGDEVRVEGEGSAAA